MKHRFKLQSAFCFRKIKLNLFLVITVDAKTVHEKLCDLKHCEVLVE